MNVLLQRRRALLLASFAGGCLSVLTAGSSSGSESLAARKLSAAENVREALQREVYGLPIDRERLLSEAAKSDPKSDAARWHSGLVKDSRGRWQDATSSQLSAGDAKRLAEYQKFRDAQADTVDGHLAVANYCAKNKLGQQERAHLSRVVDLATDHAEARQRLGFVRVQGDWISPLEAARQQIQRQSAEQALATWRPIMQELLTNLQHRSADRRAKAKERLLKIIDPNAIAAMDEVLSPVGEAEELLVVEALGGIDAPEATTSLSRHAVFSASTGVRLAACEKLRTRPLDSFVPQFLTSLYTPVTSRVTATALPTGRIGYRHEFAREGQDRKELLVLDTEYQRIAQPGGSRAQSTASAALDATRQAMRREQAVAMQNRLTAQMNERILAALAASTLVSLPAEPDAWWQWWNEKNEVFVLGGKSVATIQQKRTVSIVDAVPQTSGGGGGSSTGSGGTRLDCLAAGTIVWTASGQQAIEKIRVGDLVLSQDAETGELAYKPVLKTTVRPSGRLMKIQLGGEAIQTSGGHLFWVSGEGWVKSRELQPGSVVHGVNGPVRVQSVERGNTAETYNLVVADFNSYFVGSAKALSHDNTLRTPTRAIVPGLRLE